MSDFGYSLIVDPGGEDLLRCAESHDVENHSRLVINPGEGCYILINGEPTYIEEPGRYEVGTGLSPFFKPFQVFISKKMSTYTSTFYFWDTDPNVYKDITFQVPEFCCEDIHSGLLGNCSPKVNASVHIENPERFFRMLKAFEWKNDAVGVFLQKRIGPLLRKEISQKCKANPVIDINGNFCSFTDDVESGLKGFLKDFGLKTLNVQLFDLGISESFYSSLNGFYEKRARADQDIDITENIARRLFGGDMDKAVRYLMMKKGLEGESKGFNPLLWEIAKKYID